MPYDDLPLSAPGGSPIGPPPFGAPEPRRPHSSASRWVIAVAAVAAAAGGLYFWWLTRQPGVPAAPPATTGTEVAVGTNRPVRQLMELPSLDGSDALVRQFASTLSKHPQIARFLATDGLIRGIVLAVEQIGGGKTPANPLKVLRPATRLTLLADRATADPASYVRWEQDVAALTSVRPGEAAQLYVNLKPLFDQAYADLGHPGGDFDASLSAATAMLRATPEPGDEPRLAPHEGSIDYVDADLRALRPVQKQFLMIGPERRARVRAWLEAFAKALDLTPKPA